MSTRRQQIIDRLALGAATARGLSKEFGVPMAQIVDDLEHVQKSLGKKLLVEPAECEACGLVLTRRKKLTAPSRCPKCKSERTYQPRLSLKTEQP